MALTSYNQNSTHCALSRKYSGTAGRIENAQIGVFLGYASRHGHALIDRALYLPKSWTQDRARCHAACVPDDVVFATKPALELMMLKPARAAGLPFAWSSGDSVYGANRAIRFWAEAQGIGYVLSVTTGERLSLCPVAGWFADQVAALPARAKVWRRLCLRKRKATQIQIC